MCKLAKIQYLSTGTLNGESVLSFEIDYFHKKNIVRAEEQT